MDIALKIKEDFINQRVTISIPTLTFYEVNNLLRTAYKRLKISHKQAEEAYGGFLNLAFITYSSKDLFKKTLEIAISLEISSYDASYLALAEVIKAPFFTADEKLVQKARSGYVKRLTDYK